jgi:hypothetical protein
MKKVNVVFAGVLLLVLSIVTNAQNTTDFFVGKWNLVAEGAPGGDTKMIVNLDRNEGKLTGTIKIGDQDDVKFSKAEEKEASLILYFTSTHGYDIKLVLEKKDDNHVTGTLDTGIMGTFDVKGERATDNK